MVKHLSLEQIVQCGVDQITAAGILPQINQWLSRLSAVDCWQHLTQQVLTPQDPFALHHLLYKTTFADWDQNQGPPPAWFPSAQHLQTTHIAALMQELQIDSYSDLYTWSTQHRAAFWEVMVRRLPIRFRQPYAAILDLSQGIESPQWLLDARFNIVESCFQAPDDVPALLFQPEGGALTTWTYGELQAMTNRVANGLIRAGFQPGEAIAIAMPMTAEAIAIYLGIINAGGVVVSIADSFAANEIATRLRIANAKAIFTQDYVRRGGKHLPLYAKVVDANAPMAIVLSFASAPPGAVGGAFTPQASDSDSSLQIKLRAGDRPWVDFLSANDQFEAVPADPTAHINILFSSGTTGDPKAIPWTQTTPIKCAVDGHLHHDIHPGDVVAWSTNLGWMMGPWLIYASLINRATIALYYGAPTGRDYGQFVQDARVTMLGVVPSLVNTWKTTDCMTGLDWSTIRAFSSTGECSNPHDMLFLMALAGYKPIIEYCGGTEIGGGYVTGTLVQPCVPATFSTPALGLDIVILDETDQPANKGEAFLIPPSIGLSIELLNTDHHQVYFANTPPSPLSYPGSPPLRRHGDQLERLANGYYRAHGRVDDTMNLSGIKVSAAELECALNQVDDVYETAAIALSPPQGGPSQLIVYAVVAPTLRSPKDALKASLQAALKHHLNPLFKIHDLVIVPALPRTASNKVMRRVLRNQYYALENNPPSPPHEP